MLKPERIAGLVLVQDLPLEGEEMKAPMEHLISTHISQLNSPILFPLGLACGIHHWIFLSAQIGKLVGPSSGRQDPFWSWTKVKSGDQKFGIHLHG